MGAGHVRLRPGLIDEHQALRVEIGLGVEPSAPALQDVRAVLLDRVASLFLRVMARRFRKRETVQNFVLWRILLRHWEAVFEHDRELAFYAMPFAH
jgi:hypothetical protein